MRQRHCTVLVGLALAGALVVVACGGGGSPSPSLFITLPSPPEPTTVTTLDSGNFDAVVAEAEVCLVEFFNPSCSHCRKMVPIVEQLAANFDGRAVVVGVDVSASPEIAEAWRVTGVPTFVLLKGGQEISRLLGEQSYETLATILQTALDAG
jgi:thioredoxin 1